MDFQLDCEVGSIDNTHPQIDMIMQPMAITTFPTNSYDVRANILYWEKFAKLQPQLDLKVNHHFSHGVYARELLIPANTILTGEIHKFSNLNILVKGKIKVSIGDQIELIEAPFIVVSPPGTKRIAHTITDCIWITIHGTHERDIDKIKEMFIADSEKDWLEFSNSQQLELEFN